RRRSPAGNGVEIDADRHVVAQQRQLLAQVELWGQLRDRALAGADLVGAGRAPQPARECVLAGARARRAEQLEERARPEEVEVGGIGVVGVEEALAGLPLAGPGVVEP